MAPRRTAKTENRTSERRFPCRLRQASAHQRSLARAAPTEVGSAAAGLVAAGSAADSVAVATAVATVAVASAVEGSAVAETAAVMELAIV